MCVCVYNQYARVVVRARKGGRAVSSRMSTNDSPRRFLSAFALRFVWFYALRFDNGKHFPRRLRLLFMTRRSSSHPGPRDFLYTMTSTRVCAHVRMPNAFQQPASRPSVRPSVRLLHEGHGSGSSRVLNFGIPLHTTHHRGEESLDHNNEPPITTTTTLSLDSSSPHTHTRCHPRPLPSPR